ncbi:MAG: CHAT domain-containing protein [Leptolyngbyaceae cyanobacterium SL_5_14]|nr:CHAT domain-containing protein [Leptolyngbyaceae cyanobacterium SL_5_14]
MKTILFLAANPKGTSLLRLDQEVRDITEGLQRAQHREYFQLKQRWAVRPRDVQRALLEVNPQIVHFSGHGMGEEGLALETESGQIKLVDADALAGLFELFADQVECVVLNACYSEMQANAIVHHIPSVIGMNQSIGDRAALEFAIGFYDALGAGRTTEFAYKLGCRAIQMAGIAENFIPVLKQSVKASSEVPSLKNRTSHQKRIQQEIDSLQQMYDLLSEKLRHLRSDLAIQVGSAIKFQLQKEIEQAEAEHTKIEQKLKQLEDLL